LDRDKITIVMESLNKKIMPKINAFSWSRNKKLVDAKPPAAPYYLVAEDLIAHLQNCDIFIKHIYSTAKNLSRYGPVIMTPGVSTNANLFRIDNEGNCFHMDHNKSFANLLAAEGFDVYLYHPGYAERIYNRYVSQHCENSIYYQKRYRITANYSYKNLVNEEIPGIIDFVCQYSGHKEISWIGYSLGGMTAYSYFAKNADNPIKNLVTISSPMALNKLFFRFIRYINFTSTLLGFEEDAVLGNLAQNMVPLTRTIRTLPDWFVRFNLISPYLFNPMNINNATIRTLLGQISEPMPKELQKFFLNFVHKGGNTKQEEISNYLKQLRLMRYKDKNFLFFYGTDDLIATPDSIFLAREVIAPDDPDNLVRSNIAGHIDIIVGNNACEQVWKPTAEWLKDKYQK